MSITHTWTTRVTVPGLPTLPPDAPLTINGDYSVEVEKAVPAGSVSVEVDVGSIDMTKIVSMLLNADKVAMDVYTNGATGTGGQHFPLVANKSVAWTNQTPNQVNPITANITKFFLNNPGTVDGTFRATFLMTV
jgi:hypothetical protein